MPSFARFFLSAGVIACMTLLSAAQVCFGSDREFTVQVLACSDNATAQKTKESLLQKGLEAYIQQFEGAATAYRVRIGKFPSLESARQVQKHLHAQGMESWVARTGPPEPAQRRPPTPARAVAPDTTTQPSGAEKSVAISQPGIEPADNTTQTAAAQNDDRLHPPEAPGTTATQPAAMPRPEPGPPRTDPAGSAVQTQADIERMKPAAEIPEGDTILFELVINARPDFSEQQEAAPPATTTTTTAPRKADRQYAYFNPQDNTLHITADPKTIPPPCRAKLRHIVVFPVSFRQLNLHDMSIQVAMDEKTAVLALDGIARAGTTSSRGAVRDFESMLKERPLRLRYYPQRTDPDGTLHGSLFFTNGLPVAQEMVGRGLAACQGP